MKTLREAFRWAIAASCTAAAVCNILYLTGRASRTAVAYGMLALLACWAGTLLLARRERAQKPAPSDRAPASAPAASESGGGAPVSAPAASESGDRAPVSALARLRGALTAAAAVVWVITYGLTVFWRY